ncbi:cytochrome P450 [Ilyonectria destructans]|nr:cytochrome P450 [Ilyonectria destructans]
MIQNMDAIVMIASQNRMVLLPAAFVLFASCWVAYQRLFANLSDVPGPFWASISRVWLAIQFKGGKMQKTLRPIVRIAPDEGSIADPDAIKIVYTVKGSWAKTDFYTNYAPNISVHGDVFTQLDSKTHSARRRQVNALYSMTSILEAERYVDNCGVAFLEALDEAALAGKPINLTEWLQMYTFDTTTAGAMPYLRPLVPLLQYTNKRLRTAAESMKEIIRVSKVHVDDRKSAVVQRPDMLGKMFEIEEKNKDFSMDDIYTESFTAIAAGNDSTAIALRSVFYFLSKNSACKAKLQREIDDADQAGQLSDPIQYNETMKLPYLCAVLKEAMRYFPGVGLTLPRLVPKGGAEICERYFKEGTRVGINAHIVHFDKKAFGDDADVFNPERWLRPDAADMNKYMFQFGAGPRTCIGKNIALLEVHKIVPSIMRQFTITLIDSDKECKIANHWFVKQFDIMAKVERREKKAVV